ncbi:MAG: riboflavin synthase [Actinobacteria bacterium]|nr:riboflavin synthase [Actinomycetota bacterium]MBU1943885.1 riboflavin synthase [Actinomycetota bacterium]MBU2688593.1 riboflavin synthase [Actinomycetota bacterium]
MFTGIIEETGSLLETPAPGVLKITARKVLEDTRVGESIAVSGVCLTVTAMGEGWFTVDVMPQTMRSSTLGTLRPGSRVNLERALGAGGRLGGHIVNGHVDGTASVRGARQEANAAVIEFSAGEELTRYMVRRGSVAVDGVSLTIAEANEGGFSVSIIPHTATETTLASLRPGATVNVEVDIIAKYVEAFLARAEGGSGFEESLMLGGFMHPEQGE